MSSFSPRIAIIGGGPAGLILGRLLYKRSIPFTIYELRKKPTDAELAKPSGNLDLHEESGIAAFKECGLYDQFLTYTGECSEAQKVFDKHGTLLHSDEGELSKRPEISRHSITKLLTSHIPADQIKWNHKLLSATSSETSGRTEIELDFGSNGKSVFDLVIGADGAWSAVRKLLTDVKPIYDGRQLITLTICNITEKYPHLADLVGSGSFTSLGNRHGIISQRGPQDSARIYVIMSSEDEQFATTSGFAGKPATFAKERLLSDDALFGTYGPTMKELVAVACDEEAKDNAGAAVDIRPLHMLPVGYAWEHKKGSTIVGDAAHLMGPWAGEGVNLAMWDSLLLAQAIAKAYETAGKDAAAFQNALDPLLKEFEVELVARAKEKAEESYGNGDMMFSENGAKAFADIFLAYYPPPA